MHHIPLIKRLFFGLWACQVMREGRGVICKVKGQSLLATQEQLQVPTKQHLGLDLLHARMYMCTRAGVCLCVKKTYRRFSHGDEGMHRNEHGV
jgi:hypothetical protein